MKIIIKNIGKVKTAEIEIDGLTVVAGENNAGKSTISRSLYAVFNSHYHVEKRIHDERMRAICQQIFRGVAVRGLSYRSRIRSSVIEDCAKEILELDPLYKDGIVDLLSTYYEEIDKESNVDYDQVARQIMEVCELSDQDLFNTIIDRYVNYEFDGQVNNLFSKDAGEIVLQIKDEVFDYIFVDNSLVNEVDVYDMFTRAVYIDDPFVIDDLGIMPNRGELGTYAHKDALKSLLRQEQKDLVTETIATKKLEKLNVIVDQICGGTIVNARKEPVYQVDGSDKEISIKNLSAGLKTFVILKTLLRNGTIEENGTLILDEPEIHLHPKWQLVFAELIVLLQKSFDMHILLNTHSPYFLRAIQVYSAKYSVADRCKYYLARVEEDLVVFDDVTLSPEKIYQKLAAPLQTLEDIEYEQYRN